MLNLFLKTLETPNNLILLDSAECQQAEFVVIGKKIQNKIKKMFRGSLAIRQIDAGSDNACEQELVALSNAFYDIERFGIHFVASPKHADMLLITGPVTRNMADALWRAYEATPDPKIIVAVGDDAIHGGIYRGSYAIVDGVHRVLPVNYGIPGDPPTPQVILCSLLRILEILENESSKVK